jgi:catechol 2,3-dioxygenase-like lactoylglutathione lyase family enzyme
MKLNHIALNVSSINDVIDFYQNILGFNKEYQFELPADLSFTLFGINKNLTSYFCKKEQVAFEIFISPGSKNNGIAHICLEMPDRNKLITQCLNKGYKVKNIQRDNKPNLLFVWDNSGNCFEIKEENFND